MVEYSAIHLLKMFLIVRRNGDIFILIFSCNYTENSHLHLGTQVMDFGQEPKFHNALQQQRKNELTQVSALGFEIPIFHAYTVSRPH